MSAPPDDLQIGASRAHREEARAFDARPSALIVVDLERGDPVAASERAKAFSEAGERFSDGDWCRWVMWDIASHVTILDDPDGAPPHATITECVTGWRLCWWDALSAVQDPTPTVLALRALIGAARQEIPIDLSALDAAAGLAESPLLHLLVGAGYRYARSWSLAETHLLTALETPDLKLPAAFELLLVYAQSGQLHALPRLFRGYFANERSSFHHIALNSLGVLLNAGDFPHLYETVVLIEELLQEHFNPLQNLAPFRNASCLFAPDATMDLIATENRIYAHILHSHSPCAPTPWAERPAGRPAALRRIGCFFGMGNGQFNFPALKRRDRTRYETFYYFHNVPPDRAASAEDAAACDVFRALRGMEDEAIAEVIRADDLDLLVVLDAIAIRARDLVVRRRPARRIAYYGNAFGTLATPVVDALILPETMADCFPDGHATEAIVRIPDWVNLVGSSDGRFLEPWPGTPSGPLVIGTPANGMKLNQGWFDMAARLMTAEPDILLRLDLPTISRFELARLNDSTRRAGIDPQRMIFNAAHYSINFSERMSHLSLAIDSFPMSCYYSAMQVLSAGLPLLTFPGAIPSGRGTATIMNAAGLNDLICRDQADMEAKALALIRRPDILTGVRRLLPGRMRDSKLNDLEAVARAWEAALEQVLALPVRNLD
ncbi:MAG: hypothetical protein ACOVVK_07815 [Elsteraceae bacterium]